MYNGLPRTTLSYSGDALRSFNVQPTSQLSRDVRKRLFSLRIFDHIKEYQLDIVALTETWLSSEDSKNKHVIDQCVAHGYSLHHSPCTSGWRGGGVGLLVSNAIKVTFNGFM